MADNQMQYKISEEGLASLRQSWIIISRYGV